MEGPAKKCLERHCELEDKATQQLYKVATQCLDDHQFREEKIGSVGEFPTVCSQIVLTCLYLARIRRLDIFWSVNKLARLITEWTKACDTRFSLLIPFIHHTWNYKQYCHVGNTAKQCRLWLFQNSRICRRSWGFKIYIRWNIVRFFGSHTFVPISWMCKKQTSVSQSSTDAEIISLDAGLRLDGISALDLWDLIVAVLGNTNQSHKERRDPLWTNVKFVQHLTQVKNENNLKEWSMIWTMLILFLQTSFLLVRKLCCMCLKTTKQWSRWS